MICRPAVGGGGREVNWFRWVGGNRQEKRSQDGGLVGDGGLGVTWVWVQSVSFLLSRGVVGNSGWMVAAPRNSRFICRRVGHFKLLRGGGGSRSCKDGQHLLTQTRSMWERSKTTGRQ